jgi:CRISPR-associated endonuclease Csn1
MYEEEFERIWQSQCKLGRDELLTDELKYGEAGEPVKYPCKPHQRPKGKTLLQAFGVHGLIFFQRKMYWPKSVIGLCELESKQPRCARADRRAQRFRLLQEVNNLKYIDVGSTGRDEQPLSGDQRKLLLAKLAVAEKMTFDQIRKALGFVEGVKFNLEKGKRPYLLGMVIDHAMAKVVGKAWHDRPEEEKNEIIGALIDNEREDDLLLERAVKKWGMSRSQAEKALDLDFPAGHVHLSLKAIEKLLPHLENGLVYQSVSDPKKSALHAAGYLRRDELQRRIFDKLPDPKRVNNCPIGDIPNPVVKRTLVELRKVVNAILRKHGKPAAIHVEMGRDVKTRPQKGSPGYAKYQQQIADMRMREQRRADAAKKIRENPDLNVKPTREAITRYLLWEDQRHECIYSGRVISFTQLFGGEIDVDHILPYSRCLDDSQNNKVVCFRSANRDKSDRTPYEWLADSQPQQYEEICQRAAKLTKEAGFSYPKYRRFLQKELKLDDFIERQLNDMRYIAKATGEFLRCLFDSDHHVLGLKGQLTAELRWQWGLDTVLAELPDSPAWQQRSKLRDGEKNRADHRHHAIDAIVIALTNRKRLQELSRIRHKGGTEATGEVLLEPWETLRNDVKRAANGIHVSHRAERKVRGQLHEETLYGKTEKEGHWVSRKPVESLSPNEIEHIRDKGVQRIIVNRLEELGVEFGRGKKPDNKTWQQALTKLAMPSGVPIKKVRVVKAEKTIRPIREKTENEAFVKPGSTHHLCIFEFEKNGKTKREAVFIPMLEAVDRLKRKETVIRRTPPKDHPVIPPDARFVMSLSRGEKILVEKNGREMLLVFRTAASTTQQMIFTEHTDARKSTDAKKISFMPNTLGNARKVTVDTLGRIRWAGD